jgi:hypothetical protein
LAFATAGHELELRAMLKVNRGGSADKEATDVAVKPNGFPFKLAVMIATPAAWRRNISLKVCSKPGTAFATVVCLLGQRGLSFQGMPGSAVHPHLC